VWFARLAGRRRCQPCTGPSVNPAWYAQTLYQCKSAASTKLSCSRQMLAVNHSVLLPALPRADHLSVCLSVAQRAILGHKSIIISAAIQGRKVIILPLSGGVSKD